MQALIRARWIIAHQRAGAGLSPPGAAALLQVRFMADRGLSRKDYSDPGYQASGYINPSWYSPTHEGKFKSSLPREPLYCGNTMTKKELARKTSRTRRLGDARKQYEESKAINGERCASIPPRRNRGATTQPLTSSSSSASSPPWEIEEDRLRSRRARVVPPRVSVMDEDTPELRGLECLEKDGKKSKAKGKKPPPPPKQKRLFKGRIETDYADFKYMGSGLDEFTNKIKERKEKKIRQVEESLGTKRDASVGDSSL